MLTSVKAGLQKSAERTTPSSQNSISKVNIKEPLKLNKSSSNATATRNSSGVCRGLSSMHSHSILAKDPKLRAGRKLQTKSNNLLRISQLQRHDKNDS